MSSRKKRREGERLEAKIREKLTLVTEKFTSAFLADTVDPDDEKLNTLYEDYTREWRQFAGNTIRLNPKIYSTKIAKERLLNAFENFCENLYGKVTGSVDKSVDNKGIS